MPAPIELASGIFRVPIAPWSTLNTYVFVESDGSLTLIDCGVKGTPKKLVAALDAIGKQPSDVRRIVLTHAHPDHAGGASKMRTQTGAPVAIHSDDEPYARSGKQPPKPKTTKLGRVLGMWSWPGCPIDEQFADGDVLDVAGGLLVVHTPGHTPGHVSLLHKSSGVLITGDALFNWRKLSYAPALLCANAPMTRETAARLGELDYEVAAFTHGPEMRDRARDQIRGFLSRRRVA